MIIKNRIVVYLAFGLLGACQVKPPVETPLIKHSPGSFKMMRFSPDNEIEVRGFSSHEELDSFVRGHLSPGPTTSLRRLENRVARRQGEEIVITGTRIGRADLESYAHISVSKTNVQVQGVDEADILKTDGTYIYTVTGKTLFIIKAYPGEKAEVVSTLELDNKPSGLFVNGKKLAIFGDYYNMEFFADMKFSPRHNISYFNIYDIRDKKNPKLEKEYKFEGRYFRARMTEEYVYFVTIAEPELSASYSTPAIIDGTEARTVPLNDIHYYTVPYESVQFANIHAIDLAGLSVTSKVIAVDEDPEMYMSDKNIYIAYPMFIEEEHLIPSIYFEMVSPLLDEEHRQLAEKIKTTDNDVLSWREKESKLMNLAEIYIKHLNEEDGESLMDDIEEAVSETIEELEHLEFTVIHKISVDKNDIHLAASGTVRGVLTNQFSMDEYEGVLRIATTESAFWPYASSVHEESTNNIFTLDKELKVLDEVGDIAKGERIYSTRFKGKMLYMVTFRKVDPFFVFDLGNPTRIRQLGKLKIPGFSRYLHPYDRDTIIGIGRDAALDGRVEGLKISLFDVSDVSKPKEVAKYVAKGSYARSSAEFEHKAFLFSKEKNLLVIPAYGLEARGYDVDAFNGAMIFNITKDSIDLRGIVDHSSVSDYSDVAVQRSLYIGELLYTKSPTLLRINRLSDLRGIKRIELESSSY